MTDLNDLAREVRAVNIANGWVHPIETPQDKTTLIALIMTEGAEAIEEIRNGHDVSETYYSGGGEADPLEPLNEDGTPRKPEGMPAELADIIIRTLDTAELFGIDIQEAFDRKLEYNATRGHRHGDKVV